MQTSYTPVVLGNPVKWATCGSYHRQIYLRWWNIQWICFQLQLGMKCSVPFYVYSNPVTQINIILLSWCHLELSMYFFSKSSNFSFTWFSFWARLIEIWWSSSQFYQTSSVQNLMPVKGNTFCTNFINYAQ